MPFSRPPQEVLRFNRTSPQAQNIKSAGLITQNKAGESFAYDFAANGLFSPHTTNPDFAVDEFGPKLRFNVSSRNREALVATHLGATFFDGHTSCTAMVIAKFHGSQTAAEDSLMGQWSDTQNSTSDDQKRILFRYDSATPRLESFISFDGSSLSDLSGTISIEDGQYHCMVLHWDGVTLANWLDGVQLGAGSAHAGSLQSASSAVFPEVMGGHFATQTGTDDSPRFDLKAWGYWLPALPTAVVPSLYHQPWDLYEERRRNYFVPAAAGSLSNYQFPHRMFG